MGLTSRLICLFSLTRTTRKRTTHTHMFETPRSQRKSISWGGTSANLFLITPSTQSPSMNTRLNSLSLRFCVLSSTWCIWATQLSFMSWTTKTLGRWRAMWWLLITSQPSPALLLPLHLTSDTSLSSNGESPNTTPPNLKLFSQAEPGSWWLWRA